MKSWLRNSFGVLILGILVLRSIAITSASESDLKAAFEDYQEGRLSNCLASLAKYRMKSTDNDSEISALTIQCLRRYGLLNEAANRLDSLAKHASDRIEWKAADFLLKLQLGKSRASIQESVEVGQRLGVLDELIIEAGVLGSLAQRDIELAGRWFEHLDSKAARLEMVSYLSGVLSIARSQFVEAQSLFTKLLDRTPTNELAWMRMADLYANGTLADIDKESKLWTEIRRRFPASLAATGRLAHAMRNQGRSTEALAVLAEPPHESWRTLGLEDARVDPIERISLELDAARYSDALRGLASLGLDGPSGMKTLLDRMFYEALRQGDTEATKELGALIQTAILTEAYGNQLDRSVRIREQHVDRVSRLRRLADLRTMKQIATTDPGIEEAIRKVEDLSVSFPSKSLWNQSRANVSSFPDDALGGVLYRTHCASCHGLLGNGRGAGSRYLHPAARDFQREPIRYVSATNSLANDADLYTTIREGLQGTSMRGFPDLLDEEIRALIRQIRVFQRDGLQAKLLSENAAVAFDSSMDKWMNERMLGNATLPEFLVGDSSSDRIEAGKIAFRRLGCIQCHSLRDNEQDPKLASAWFLDSVGRTIKARDLTGEPLRRGTNASEIHRRIVLGIPGTPHPSLRDHSNPQELSDLVLFIRSLQNDELNRTTNYERK